MLEYVFFSFFRFVVLVLLLIYVVLFFVFSSLVIVLVRDFRGDCRVLVIRGIRFFVVSFFLFVDFCTSFSFS